MSSTLNGSSALEHFEHSNAIKIHKRNIFNFYPGLPHILEAFVLDNRIYHSKYRLVVSTAEWLPWLHGLLVVEANCIRQSVSLLFPHSGIRKRGGNSKETTSLVTLAMQPG